MGTRRSDSGDVDVVSASLRKPPIRSNSSGSCSSKHQQLAIDAMASNASTVSPLLTFARSIRRGQGGGDGVQGRGSGDSHRSSSDLSGTLEDDGGKIGSCRRPSGIERTQSAVLRSSSEKGCGTARTSSCYGARLVHRALTALRRFVASARLTAMRRP